MEIAPPPGGRGRIMLCFHFFPPCKMEFGIKTGLHKPAIICADIAHFIGYLSRIDMICVYDPFTFVYGDLAVFFYYFELFSIILRKKKDFSPAISYIAITKYFRG
jgi:hypothetical protein